MQLSMVMEEISLLMANWCSLEACIVDKHSAEMDRMLGEQASDIRSRSTYRKVLLAPYAALAVP
jgi:hypothetical protein